MSLDLHDPEAVRRWARDLTELLADLRLVTLDMLARRRAQRLGHAIHAEKCREGWEAVEATMAHILPPDDDDESSKH